MNRFWEEKRLDQLSQAEWESLCDGCAKCCLQKLEDDETGEVHYTKIVCRYLNEPDCQCTVYDERNRLVPNCVQLTVADIGVFHWLPTTCAYRLVAEGKPLFWWHPLLSSNRQSVHEAGISIRGRCLSETYVHPDGWEEHIISWVE